jgi:single-strand DNA-binding protein
MNKLIIIGNLTRDVELRTTQSGKSVANFTLAVNRRAKPGEKAEADFFRVSVWDKQAETCQKYLAKGRKVCVIGSVSVSTYTANDGSTRATLEVFAQDVEFLDSAKQDAPQTEARGAAQPPAQAQYTPVYDEDLPF